MDVDDSSMALVQIGRCGALPVLARWPMSDEWTVDVTELRYEMSDGAGQELSFGYASRCAISDIRCFGNELDAIWPKLQPLAERDGVHALTIGIEECLGASVSFTLHRSTDGRWDRSLWSPPGRDPED